MNKLLIVLLAVCLVSVHAFVKRDAPAAATPESDDLLKKITDTMTALGETTSTKLKETFDPETLKKNFNELVDNFSKKVDELKPKPASS